ncbi:hypothetical protein GCM10011506_15250 [Marivirga lumbricoides]|uniref:PhzF family phenazine biosynthesis protein n=1 Tax=Marivirga lumbricoides TaxID=1046115 RepID=A0ABQ1LZ84_9BACT|nr:hypothetical protein GCM10011506_15250 [Marivirga lumbricoides]
MPKHFPFAIINAFSNLKQDFLGNPCAVMLLDKPISSEKMQAIAKDLHQPATSFLWATDKPDVYNVRWYAPDAEIGLCGHGSLASIAFLSNQSPKGSETVGEFKLISGTEIISGRSVSAQEYEISLHSIASKEQKKAPKGLEEALGNKIIHYLVNDNKHIVVLESEQQVKEMKPDFAALRKIDTFGYAVTAPSNEVDFVSRTIVPHVQQLEDHATGSSHALLVPYWSEKLNKQQMISKQLSPRGGYFKSGLDDEFVHLTGQTYSSVEGSFLM